LEIKDLCQEEIKINHGETLTAQRSHVPKIIINAKDAKETKGNFLPQRSGATTKTKTHHGGTETQSKTKTFFTADPSACTSGQVFR